jgi:hypothetical protein
VANPDDRLELAICSNDLARARRVAGALGGTLYWDSREAHSHLPFRALVTCVTDALPELHSAADVGLYLVCRRVIKPGTPRAVGVFPMVRHPALTHEQADEHWREQHAPLTFEHHADMTHYSQLSVLHCFRGPGFDGIALCGFDSEAALRENFYTHPYSADVIAADVSKFADTKRSPRRLVAAVECFAGRGAD